MNDWKFLLLALGLFFTSGVWATPLVGEYHIDTLGYIVEPDDAKRFMTARSYRGSRTYKPAPEVPKYRLVEEQSKTWFERKTAPRHVDRPTAYSLRHSTTQNLVPNSEKVIAKEDLSFQASAPKEEVDYEDLFRPLPGGGENLKKSASKEISDTAHSPRPAGGKVRRSVGRRQYTFYTTLLHGREAEKQLALEREIKWRKYEWRDLQTDGYSDLADEVKQEIQDLENLEALPDVSSPFDEPESEDTSVDDGGSEDNAITSDDATTTDSGTETGDTGESSDTTETNNSSTELKIDLTQ